MTSQLANLARIGQLKTEPASEKWRVLDQAHNKRNVAEYEGELDVQPELLEALLRVTNEVDKLVSALAPIPET